MMIIIIIKTIMTIIRMIIIIIWIIISKIQHMLMYFDLKCYIYFQSESPDMFRSCV